MPINVREYYFSTLSLEILHYSISTLMAMWSAYIVFTIHLQSVSKQISNVDTKEADVPSTPKVSEDKPGQRFVYSYL